MQHLRGAGLARLTAVCGVVFAAGYLCQMAPRELGTASPIWLPNAILLSLLILSRRTAWMGLGAAGALGQLAANLAMGSDPPLAAVFAACNTAESLGCAWLLARLIGRTPDMARIGNLLRYAGVVAAGAVVSGGVATGLLQALGGPPMASVFWTWAMADFAGLVVVTPCLVALGADRASWRRLLSRQGWPLAVLVAVVTAVFVQDRYPLTYVVVAALLLVTWRLRIPGAAVGVLATLAIAMACTLAGRGPFAFIDGGLAEQVLALQALLAVCFYVSVPVAAQAARSRALKEALAGALAETRAAEARYRQIAERAHDIIVRADLTGRIVYVSPSCRALGYAPDELIGTSGVELVHPEDRGHYIDNTTQLVRDGVAEQPRDRQHRFRCKDGAYVWLEGNPTVLTDDDGKPIELLNVLRDVTDRRAAQAELAAKRAELETLTDHAPDMLVRIGPDDRIVYASPASRQFGYEPEDLIGRLRSELIHPEDLELLSRRLTARAAGRELPQGDSQYRIRRGDGGWTWVEGSLSLVRDEGGAIVGAISLLRDVEERRAAAEALADSEARYRLLTDNMTDVIACYARDGVLRYLSPAVESLLGYEASELVGRSIVELMHPDDVEASGRHFAEHFAAGPGAASFRFEYRLFHKDGRVVWLEAHPRAIYDPETGDFVEWQDTVRDITERRAMQDALADSEARYRTLAENVSDILVRFGPDGLVRYISASCRGIGIDPDTAVGKSVMTLIAPDHAAYTESIVAALFSGAEADPATRRVHRLVTRDGREIWLEGSPKLVRDADGKVVEVVSVLRDVSARMQVDAALGQSEARFRLYAENANDLIMQSDPDGRITYISPSCEAVTGYAPEEVIGRRAMDWMHPDDTSGLIEAFRAQVMGGGAVTPVSVEFRITTKDGREVWLEACPRATQDPVTGRVTGVTDVARDITGRKAMEAELRAAQAEAEASAAVKAEFLANMSHELRTPLTSVVGFTKLALEQPELAPLTRTYVERVGDASRALLSAVNDILDFSKLEAGQLTFRPEPVRFRDFASSALQLFQPQAGAKDLDLVLECDAAADDAVLVDPDRMRQVLLNLIGNAVKFTDAGRVTLQVAYDDAAGRLDVAVRDTGPGIPADKMDRLFKRFSQVDGSLTRTGGTGLGLAICKGIVEALGGEIGATSAVGQGSCFAFQVPLPRVEAAVEPGARLEHETVTFGGVRVLVVDDHPANRELVGLILAGVGAEVTPAEDGEEAAELAGQWPYDVILMDIRMPRLDGPGALARIRGARGPNDATPILAFTADADPRMAAEWERLGFQGVVSKPVSPPELVAAIAQATAFEDDAWAEPEGARHAG